MGGVHAEGTAKAEVGGFCQLLLECHQEPWGCKDDHVEPTMLGPCLYVCDNRNEIWCRSTKQFLLLPITNLRSLVISVPVLSTVAVAGGRAMASIFILGSHMK